MMTFRFNKLSILLLSALLGSAVTLHSQDAGNKPQPPAGPLVQATPNPGQWTVTFSYPEDRQSKNTNTSTASSTILNGRIRSISTTKVKDITHVEGIRIQADKQDSWYVGNTVYGKIAGSNVWAQSMDKVDDSSPLANSGQFADVGWITTANYLGNIAYGGRDCMVFASIAPANFKLSDTDAFKKLIESSPLLAFIDSQTRYPVEIHTSGVYRFFQFSDPPKVLTLPDDLIAQVKDSKKVRALSTQRAPVPY